MKLNRLIFPVMAMLLLLVPQAAIPALAQSSNAARPVHTYRVIYTLTDMDGSKKLGSQQYAMAVSTNDNNQNLKLGSRVPVATGPAGSQQFQYYDVGLNIHVRLEDVDEGKVSLTSSVDQSSLMDGTPADSSIKGVPVIRQVSLNNTSVVSMGGQVTLGSLDIPGSTRHVNVEVVVNRL